MSAAARALLLAALVAGAAGGWWWWNNPEREIRRLLADVASALSHEAGRRGMGDLATAAALQRHLDAAVVVEPGPPFEPVSGRDHVVAAAMRLRAPGQAVQVRFSDVRIEVGPGGQRATVEATVTAEARGQAGSPQVDAREVVLTLARADARWVVTHARVVPVLERIS